MYLESLNTVFLNKEVNKNQNIINGIDSPNLISRSIDDIEGSVIMKNSENVVDVNTCKTINININSKDENENIKETSYDMIKNNSHSGIYPSWEYKNMQI